MDAILPFLLCIGLPTLFISLILRLIAMTQLSSPRPHASRPPPPPPPPPPSPPPAAPTPRPPQARPRSLHRHETLRHRRRHLPRPRGHLPRQTRRRQKLFQSRRPRHPRCRRRPGP